MADTRARKGDVTPDSQREQYEARGGEVTSISDEMEQEYQKGKSDGAKEAGASTPPAPASPGRPRLKSNGNLAIGAPLAVETILISINAVTQDKHPPYPSQLLVAFAFFGLLGLASGDAAGPASALGWGIVAATFYAGSGAKGKPPAIGALNTIGRFFGGGYAAPGSLAASSPAGVRTTSVTSEAGSTALQ